MKRILTLILLVFMAAPAVAEAPHKPQIYDYDGAPVDPLCFLSNVGTEDTPIYPTRHCRYEEIVNVGQSGLDESKFVGVSYEENYYDAETEETHTSFGFIGYRAIGMVEYKGQDLLALILAENGGGSGTFTSIMLLDPVRDDAEKTMNYHHVETLAVGDRCMGGVKDAQVKDGDLYFYLHTTMADMLALSGDPERDILQGEAASGLPFCAVCCYAEAEYDLTEFRGVRFPPDRHKPEADNGEAAMCVEDLITLNEQHANQTYFGAEDFGFLVREIEHTCLGRVEGE